MQCLEYGFSVNSPCIIIDDLIESSPELQKNCKKRKSGEKTRLVYDFSKSSNQFDISERTVLEYFGLEWYELDRTHLCPRVPNRLEYLKLIEHCLMEGLELYRQYVKKEEFGQRWIVDIGTGSSMIYPVIGQHMHPQNRFLCTEIDPDSVAHAKKIIRLNPDLKDRITLLQPDGDSLIPPSEQPVRYIVCNPPFYKSLEHMQSLKKRGKSDDLTIRANELYCDGGEYAFIKRIINSSIELKDDKNFQDTWFTTQVGIQSNVELVLKYLESAGIKNVWKECIRFGTSRWIVGWCFNNHLRSTALDTSGKEAHEVLSESVLIEMLDKLGHPYELLRARSGNSQDGHYLLISAPLWLRRVRRLHQRKRESLQGDPEYKLILRLDAGIHILYNASGVNENDIVNSWNKYKVSFRETQ